GFRLSGTRAVRTRCILATRLLDLSAAPLAALFALRTTLATLFALCIALATRLLALCIALATRLLPLRTALPALSTAGIALGRTTTTRLLGAALLFGLALAGLPAGIAGSAAATTARTPAVRGRTFHLFFLLLAALRRGAALGQRGQIDFAQRNAALDQPLD